MTLQEYKKFATRNIIFYTIIIVLASILMFVIELPITNEPIRSQITYFLVLAGIGFIELKHCKRIVKEVNIEG